MRRSVVGLIALAASACGGADPAATGGGGGAGGDGPAPIATEAIFVDVPPRHVILHGAPVDLAATARMFVSFRPAETNPETAPIVVAFNGFATDIVQSFGTGPTTVALGGAIVDNPDRLTKYANLVFVDPRQSGYSYDVVEGRAAGPQDCSRDVFNEYVDAGDVLFAVLRFLEARPRLAGPVVWLGESYAGVRIAWMLAYLRGRWDLAPYRDDALASEIVSSGLAPRLVGRQVLLEPWLLGQAHSDAIAAACLDPMLVTAVSASIGSPCGSDACACADAFQRSRYDYAFTVAKQDERVRDGVAAHVSTSGFEALLGVAPASVAGLASAARRKGFKCDGADATVPPEDELVAALGALPEGQRYYLPYNPLQPGKELDPAPPDWRTENLVGAAFVDDLVDVDTFVTDGPLDLVVPTSALAPGLRLLLGDDSVTTSVGAIGVATPGGQRTIAVHAYPSAGHMITMLEPAAFSADLAGWLGE